MSEGDLPLPQGPWGFPGIGGAPGGGEPTHTPSDKKKQHNRRREREAKKSRQKNRKK
jgi:hypothetical protein